MSTCRGRDHWLWESGRSHGLARNVHLELSVLELGERQQSAFRRFRDEQGELRLADVLLVERAVDLLHHLLQAIRAHYIAIALHSLHRFGDELPWIVLHHLVFSTLHEAGESVVRVVLVAVHDEQITRRFTNPDAYDVLSVFLELDDEAGEIGITGEKDERPDLRALEDELERIDREA